MGAQPSGAPVVLSAGRGTGEASFGVEEMTSVAWGWPAAALPALLPWHGAREGWMDGRTPSSAEGWQVSWDVVSNYSAVGLKFWEARRKINLPFFSLVFTFFTI